MEWLKELIESLSSKVDKLDEKLDTQNSILHEQHIQIKEHIRRTEIAEANIDLLRNDLQPLQKHVTQVNFVFKVIGFLSTVIGTIYGIVSILDYLHQ